eukprot:1550447-Rhodomonas_salina.1
MIPVSSSRSYNVVISPKVTKWQHQVLMPVVSGDSSAMVRSRSKTSHWWANTGLREGGFELGVYSTLVLGYRWHPQQLDLARNTR